MAYFDNIELNVVHACSNSAKQFCCAALQMLTWLNYFTEILNIVR